MMEQEGNEPRTVISSLPGDKLAPGYTVTTPPRCRYLVVYSAVLLTQNR